MVLLYQTKFPAHTLLLSFFLSSSLKFNLYKTDIITLTNGSDFWLNPISGVAATVLFLGIGIVLRSIRIKKERQLGTEDPQLFTL